MYVNIDMYMKGRFDPGGVPSLRAFVADVVKDVPDGDSTRLRPVAAVRMDARPAGAAQRIA